MKRGVSAASEIGCIVRSLKAFIETVAALIFPSAVARDQCSSHMTTTISPVRKANQANATQRMMPLPWSINHCHIKTTLGPITARSSRASAIHIQKSMWSCIEAALRTRI